MKLALTPAKVSCIVSLVILAAIALSGSIDRVANENLDGALAATGAIYATARGINALVSVLQGTELDLPFVTLAIGEVLDPVNDLIERFSTIVLFALGAVAAQKILLLLVASNIFNYLFTGIALLCALGVATAQARVFAPLLKIFLIALFVRFSLGAVVLANHWIDTTFLDTMDRQRHASMQTFEGELRKVKNIATKEADLADATETAQEQILELESLIETASGKLSGKVDEIAEAESRLARQLEAEDRVCRVSLKTPILSPTCSDTAASQSRELQVLEHEASVIEEHITGLREELEIQRAHLACLGKRAQGEACTLWDKLPEPPDVAAIQNKLRDLDRELDEFTENAWLLLISVLLKSVALPLLFFYALLKFTRLVWTWDFEKACAGW